MWKFVNLKLDDTTYFISFNDYDAAYVYCCNVWIFAKLYNVLNMKNCLKQNRN